MHGVINRGAKHTLYMKDNLVSILLALNILVTGGMGGWIATSLAKGGMTPSASGGEAATVKLDLTDAGEPLDKFGSDVRQLTAVIQRFNTSLIQYDFLKQEMARLNVVDRTIGARAQATAAAKNDENQEAADKALAQLDQLAKQVQGEQNSRRQTMIQLISGLEKQLAGLTLDSDEVSGKNGTEVKSEQVPETKEAEGE